MLSHVAQNALSDRSLCPNRRVGARVIAIRLTVVLLSLTIGIGAIAGHAEAKGHKRHGAHHGVKNHGRQSRSVATHIGTWAFDDGCNGGVAASSRLVRAWLSYAESDCGPRATKASVDCHAHGRVLCDVMQYLDTNWAYPTGADHVPMARMDSVSNWLLHTPMSMPLATIFSSGLGGGYLMNQMTPDVQSFFHSYVRAHYDSADGLLMDWQVPSLTQELYYSNCGCSTTREIPSNAMLRTAHQQMAAALTHRNGKLFIQADNSLPANPYLPQGLGMLNHALGVDAWVAEGEPLNYGVLDAYYSTLLDQMAYITHRKSAFVVLLSRAPAGASYQQRSRRVQEATVLLGFKPGRVVDWAGLENGSRNLAVWPEEGIYPTAPVQSMASPGGRGCLAGTGVVCRRGGHNSVQVAPGVYRRVFRDCYNRQVPFGPCAVIVNTSGAPVVVRSRWLRGASLQHQITFAGGDVQSGGRVNLAGAPFTAGSTSVGADDALLLAR